MLWLLENTDECMVGTAAANVAVDALLRKVVEGYRSRHPEGNISLVRVYSQSQIFAQYATGELELMDEECYPEAVRVKRAGTDPRFAPFIDAVRQLRTFGKLRDEADYKAYIAEGSKLTRMILESGIRIVFCTVASHPLSTRPSIPDFHDEA